MQVFWDIFWAVWAGMLLIGDPIALVTGGERATDTHFLASQISLSIRVPILAWVVYHFIWAHRNG